jgi:hypothetical protein
MNRIGKLSLDQRETLQNVIGIEYEKMVDYFCCEDRKHFPINFDRTDNLILKDWMAAQEIPISREELRILLTLHLADHLEQLPYTRDYRHGEFFRRASPFLSAIARDHFTLADGGQIPALG